MKVLVNEDIEKLKTILRCLRDQINELKDNKKHSVDCGCLDCCHKNKILYKLLEDFGK